MNFMGSILPDICARLARRGWVRGSFCQGAAILAVSLAFFAAACHYEPSLDTRPLDAAGFTYSAIQKLKALNIASTEVGDIVEAREGGLSEESCINLVRLYHQRGKPFNAGAAVASFVRSGMREDKVLELGALDQLGLGSGELQAMRLAGLSDEIVVEVALHRAVGKEVLSGASLAGMRNAGLHNTTIFELVHRDVRDSQANAILSLRRHGASDAEILRRFSGS
jgi:hypothetical protein